MLAHIHLHIVSHLIWIFAIIVFSLHAFPLFVLVKYSGEFSGTSRGQTLYAVVLLFLFRLLADASNLISDSSLKIILHDTLRLSINVHCAILICCNCKNGSKSDS